LFSMIRLLSQCVMPRGQDYTFWGRGVSQGHSDAIRRIAGVRNAVQYTVPMAEALQKVRSGLTPQLGTADKHRRVCYVVAEEGADQAAIAQAIKTMPHYFDEYDTSVDFISQDEFAQKHSGMPHAGLVIRSGTTGKGNKQRLEFSLELDSNPEFTAGVLVAYARAVGRMAKEGQVGARSVFDVPLSYFSSRAPHELRKTLL